MALSYSDVRDVYDPLQQSGAVAEDLPTWSQKMNELTGSDLYSAGVHDNIIKRASHGIDKLLESTGLPEASAGLGRSVGGLVGAPEAGENIGRGLPRSVINFLPLLIPGGGGVGVAAKLGLTGLLSGSEAYTESGSPLAGLISGATAAALPGVANVGEQALLKYVGAPLEKAIAPTGEAISRYVGSNVAQKLGGLIGGQAAAAGTMEAGQAATEVSQGQTPTNPFSVENLLNLTLGQAPFALAHLGGKAIGLATKAGSADVTDAAVKQSTNVIEQRQAKDNFDAETGVEKVPTTENPEPVVSPQVTQEITNRLAQVRGEQIAVKADDTLSPDARLEATNKLLLQEMEFAKSKPPTPDTVLGNNITPEQPRTEVIAKELRRNKLGTWRAISVADDPTNPEELRGKVIGYSTKDEPNPVYGFQSQETGHAKFSLPDPQWWTVKSQDEWNSKFPTKTRYVEQTPELERVAQPMSEQELSAHLNELAKVEIEAKTSQTPSDMQQAVTHLNDVEAQADLSPTRDEKIRAMTQKLVDAGADPAQAPKLAVAALSKRTAQKVSARELERSVPPLSPEEAADISARMGGEGFSVVTADKLSHNATEDTLDVKPVSDIVTDTAAATARSREAQQAFHGWEGNEDTTYQKDFADFLDLVEKYGSPSKVPFDEAAKYLNDRFGTISWEGQDIKDFLQRPHVKIWSRDLDINLAKMQQDNAAPIVGTNPMVLGLPKAFSTLGQKDIALIDSQPFRDKIVSGFQGAKRMIDAFSGSGVISRFARWAGFGNELVENTIPVKGKILERIQNDPTFANTVDALGKQVSAVGNDANAVKQLLENAPDSDAALFIANNTALRQREITDLSQYSPAGDLTRYTKLKNMGELVNQLREQIGTVTTEDGWKKLSEASKGDFVVADPTYIDESGKTGYGTGREDANILTAIDRINTIVKPASEKGVKIMYTNAWHPELVKALEDAGFNVDKLQRKSYAPELVATNYDVAQTDAASPGVRTGKVVARDLSPYIPQTQEEINVMNKLGLDRGGLGLNDYLVNHPNPFFSAVGKDLAKFQDSLQRVSARMVSQNGASVSRIAPDRRVSIDFSPGILNSTDYATGYTVAHELVHGVTQIELNNPQKVAIVNRLTELRRKLIDALPTRERIAFDSAESSGWYKRYANGEAGWNELAPDLTPAARSRIYGLFDNHEFVAQGMSDHDFIRYLQSTKVGNATWFSRFSNIVKSLLGINEAMPGSAWEEFLSHTDQLMEKGNYVASFHNFANRYFLNKGMTDQAAAMNTSRALGLMADAQYGTTGELMLNFDPRSAEFKRAHKDLSTMFREGGDDAAVTFNVMDELGYGGDPEGFSTLTRDAISGNLPDHGTVIDLLPPTAQKYVFEYAKDLQNVVGVIRAATLEGNEGVLNIANPELIRGPVKDALNLVNKIVAQEKIQQGHVQTMQDLYSVAPSGYMDKLSDVTSPAPPTWAVGSDKTKDTIGWIWRNLAPVGQLVKRIPEAAEAFTKGRQLNENARKMSSESLKAFGTDLETMELSHEANQVFNKVSTTPKLEQAINKLIHATQVEGKKTGEIKRLDDQHPEVQKILAPLTDAEREQVNTVLAQRSISQQHMNEQVLEKMLQIATTRGASVAQGMTGTKLKDNTGYAESMMQALTVDRADPQQSQMADAQLNALQKQMAPEAFLELLKYGQGEAEKWKLWKDYFQKNPDWASGQRYGKYLVTFKRAGKTFLLGVESRKEAESVAQNGTIVNFEKNYKASDDSAPSFGGMDVTSINRLKELEDNQIGILRNRGVLASEDDVAEYKRSSLVGQFATEEAYRGGIPGLTPPPRGLTKGAEELPWLQNHFSWINKTSTYWSRQLLRAEAQTHLLDPEIAQNDQLRTLLKTNYENLLHPDTQTGKFFRRSVMTWFMGFNPASAIINATQPFLTHVSEMTNLTGKPIDSYKRTLGAFKDIITEAKTGKWDDKDVEWMIHNAHKDGQLDFSMFDDQAAAQESIATNHKRAMARNRPQTLGQRLGTYAGAYSTAGMWMFRQVERFNNMAALVSSFKYFKESQPELGRNEWLQKAYEFNDAVNYGGGAYQRPVGLFAGRGAFPRTAAMLATSMQSYVLGTTFQIARYIRSGFFRPAGITPAEVYSARKAAVQMLGTQLAAAGVIGLPFVSGALAVLNQAFPGLEVNRKLRETIDGLLGSDEENGHILSDAAMTGVPSMFGWDLQSRLSMGNTVPGVSEINGFDPELLLGAPANLVSTFVKGGQKLFAGDPHAIDNFMPSALKKIEQLVRSGGQVQDYRNRPIFQPTTGESIGIALGFQPKRLTDFNAADRIARQSQDNATRQVGQFHQQMAEETLKGNFGTVRQALLARAQEDKTYNPVEGAHAVSRATEELTFPRDLRNEGNRATGAVRSRLLSTFNIPPSSPSETDRLNFRSQVGQRLGLPLPSSTDLRQAQLVDQLRRSDPEASRAELRQRASLLSRGPHLQTLGEPPG